MSSNNFITFLPVFTSLILVLIFTGGQHGRGDIPRWYDLETFGMKH